MTRCRRAFVCGITALAFIVFMGAGLRAQGPQDRILRAIRDSEATRLRGNVAPLARAEFDRGKAADSALLPRITIFFKPTPSQQAELSQLLSEQQDRSSPNYHRWMTPREFGARFGLSQNDLDRVTTWLASRGFAVQDVPASRNAVSFSGSAWQVATSFGTEIHRYTIRGEQHYANSGEPSVPGALADVIAGFAGLNDFRPQPKLVRPAAVGAKPAFTDAASQHFLAPGDFGLIYDVNPLYARGIDGSGQKIAIVGQSDIQLSDIQEFRTLLNLPVNNPQVVLVPGASDPGMADGDLQEADLDLEWAGAIARNASLIYVNSQSAWDSLQYAVTADLAPVIGVSYTACEPLFSAAETQNFLLLAQQANAQGQTIVAASGDSGAAGCDDLFAAESTKGLAVNMPASLPFVTAVGGSEFSEGAGSYWSASNNGDKSSALSYIPEVAWNDTPLGFGIQATGGGASTLFSKPMWQSGAGVPNDGVRDLPDVALSASASHDAYLVCDETHNSSTATFTPVCPNGAFGGFDAVGGTSAGTPAFAGIVALLNQSMNSAQGNINYVLYLLASASTNPLHAISTGNNIVPCQTNPAAPGCPTSGSGAGQFGYAAGLGYNLATGLGSIDASALISAWPSITVPPGWDISVSPPNLTLSRGGRTSAQITVSKIGGLTGTPVLGCTMPAIFVGVTCSIASQGPNSYTLTVVAANSSAELFPSAPIGSGARFAAGIRDEWRSWGAFGLGIRGETYLFGISLLIAITGFSRRAQRIARGRAKFAALIAMACCAAALVGCAGAASGGNGGSGPLAIQLTPQSAYLGAGQKQQFTATVANASNSGVNWSVSSGPGSVSAVTNAGVTAVVEYAAPSTLSGSQSVTITATSAADPSKQASANILLLPGESGAIQVTGSMNGMSRSVAVSLNVN